MEYRTGFIMCICTNVRLLTSILRIIFFHCFILSLSSAVSLCSPPFRTCYSFPSLSLSLSFTLSIFDRFLGIFCCCSSLLFTRRTLLLFGDVWQNGSRHLHYHSGLYYIHAHCTAHICGYGKMVGSVSLEENEQQR
jgi:hypothetical protein